MTIHAAELSVYSGLPRLVPVQIADGDGFQDALFQAETAEAWRNLLLGLNPTASARSDVDPQSVGSAGSNMSTSHQPETFLPAILLAQNIVNTHVLDSLQSPDVDLPLRSLSGFYQGMTGLARRYHLLTSPSWLGSQTQSLRVLWHYTCVVRLSPIRLIEEAAGRGGSPVNDGISEIREWVNTSVGRLAMLHSGCILSHAANLRDLAFLIPRCV